MQSLKTIGGVTATKTLRTSKRITKSSVDQDTVQPPVSDSWVPELKEGDSSPGENSFIYSPSRRQKRGE